MGYDRVCVLDGGRIVECGVPVELWDKEGGVFRGMCERSKIRREDFFESEVVEKYEEVVGSGSGEAKEDELSIRKV